MTAENAENAENGGYWVTAKDNGNGPFQAATARERNAENGVNPAYGKRQTATTLTVGYGGG